MVVGEEGQTKLKVPTGFPLYLAMFLPCTYLHAKYLRRFSTEWNVLARSHPWGKAWSSHQQTCRFNRN